MIANSMYEKRERFGGDRILRYPDAWQEDEPADVAEVLGLWRAERMTPEEIARAERIRDAKALLTYEERECVELVIERRVTQADVAVALGMQRRTVRTHVERGLRKLREALGRP